MYRANRFWSPFARSWRYGKVNAGIPGQGTLGLELASYSNYGSTIDLGNRQLTILAIPSHSVGDIAILDTATRSLFAGDNVNIGVSLVYQQTTPQPFVELYAAHLSRLVSFGTYFDAIYPGHQDEALDVSVLNKLLENANRIVAGDLGEPMMPDATTDPVVSDGGDKLIFEPQHKYRSTSAGVFIMYDERYRTLP